MFVAAVQRHFSNCDTIELLSTNFNLNPILTCSTQGGVDPACVPIELLSTYLLNPALKFFTVHMAVDMRCCVYVMVWGLEV